MSDNENNLVLAKAGNGTRLIRKNIINKEESQICGPGNPKKIRATQCKL